MTNDKHSALEPLRKIIEEAIMDYAVLVSQPRKGMRDYKGHFFWGKDYKRVESIYADCYLLFLQTYTRLCNDVTMTTQDKSDNRENLLIDPSRCITFFATTLYGLMGCLHSQNREKTQTTKNLCIQLLEVLISIDYVNEHCISEAMLCNLVSMLHGAVLADVHCYLYALMQSTPGNTGMPTPSLSLPWQEDISRILCKITSVVLKQSKQVSVQGNTSFVPQSIVNDLFHVLIACFIDPVEVLLAWTTSDFDTLPSFSHGSPMGTPRLTLHRKNEVEPLQKTPSQSQDKMPAHFGHEVKVLWSDQWLGAMDDLANHFCAHNDRNAHSARLSEVVNTTDLLNITDSKRPFRTIELSKADKQLSVRIAHKLLYCVQRYYQTEEHRNIACSVLRENILHLLKQLKKLRDKSNLLIICSYMHIYIFFFLFAIYTYALYTPSFNEVIVLVWHMSHLHFWMVSEDKKAKSIERQNENENENENEERSSSSSESELLEAVRDLLVNKLSEKQYVQAIGEGLSHCFLDIVTSLTVEQKQGSNVDILLDTSSPLYFQIETLVLLLPHILLNFIESQSHPCLAVRITHCICHALDIATLLHSVSPFYQTNNSLQALYDLVVPLIINCICSYDSVDSVSDGRNHCVFIIFIFFFPSIYFIYFFKKKILLLFITRNIMTNPTLKISVARSPRDKLVILQKQLNAFSQRLIQSTNNQNEQKINTTSIIQTAQTSTQKQTQDSNGSSQKLKKDKIKVLEKPTLVTTEKNEIDFSKF
ncbi:hypothetical protein RFI_20119 [Reticulomyxa filosa]|uniref:Uncharacterized protein n=1 Tax=Reticulomyxa filosa TaxID=46433 RepID=X6MTN4_RETFI|nr:hypothetical protein RFI_20119 [Reticulomyxa filosa]|eukprot:ETO17209.1 hypothetical protein RFI_20119 [Reticulomyxa filosa]